MCKVIKMEATPGSLDTEFCFMGYDSWEDYDMIQEIMKKKLKYKLTGGLDDFDLEHMYYKKSKFRFQLRCDGIYGIALCSEERNEQAAEYYQKLEEIAFEIAEQLPER